MSPAALKAPKKKFVALGNAMADAATFLIEKTLKVFHAEVILSCEVNEKEI